MDDHKLPPNETDNLQPIDRGLGQHVKIYLGQLLDEWLDEDENLSKWEDNTLTASDRRILLATWFDKAVKRALEGDAKVKYFQHAGCLLTADGSDDELIKFEGAPAGYKLKVPYSLIFFKFKVFFELQLLINIFGLGGRPKKIRKCMDRNQQP